MGLPSINITFSEAAYDTVRRGARGVVAVILRDSVASVQGGHTFLRKSDIPAAMTTANRKYLERAFIGNVNTPQKVVCYVEADSTEDFTLSLTWLETQSFNWLVGPPDTSTEDAAEIAEWVATRRSQGSYVKAVLPDKPADSMAIVNFTTDGISVGQESFNAPGYCARIAGLIAGTPLNMSATFVSLPEVTNVTRLPKSELDDAVDNGEFIIFYDGQKVKTGRGVTSLLTTAGTIAAYKKIKVVETVDLIRSDLQVLCEDNYIGKYPNTYDNKLLLLTAVKEYFARLEGEGILLARASTVEIDLAATRVYLDSLGIGTSGMSDQEIKEADTGDKVFLTAAIRIVDVIEDISLAITL